MSERDFWVGAARRLAFRRNFAAWCDLFLPSALALAALGAATLLVLRLLHLPARPLWFSLCALLLVAVLVCAWVARRHRYTFTDALVRLDQIARLHTRLSSAHAGIGPWPPPQPQVRDAVRWHWPRLGLPLLTAALLLAGASMVPPLKSVINGRPVDEPVAWSQLDSWLETLQQAQVVEPRALQKLQQQLEDLRAQPARDWYSQSSLEAGDALRQQTSDSLQKLASDLRQSSVALAAANQSTTPPPSDLQALSASLKEALQGLESGQFPLDKNLLAQLKSLDPAHPGTKLSPAQMKELQDRLAAGAKVAPDTLDPTLLPGKGLASSHRRPDLHSSSSGYDKPDGREEPGGKGGGGETAPLTLDPATDPLHAHRTQAVGAQPDLSRALPTSTVGVSKGQHDIDKTQLAQPTSGGSISSPGQGGDAVWRDSLLPEDREVLQRFFK